MYEKEFIDEMNKGLQGKTWNNYKSSFNMENNFR